VEDGEERVLVSKKIQKSVTQISPLKPKILSLNFILQNKKKVVRSIPSFDDHNSSELQVSSVNINDMEENNENWIN
jgi:hypothetical protein